MAEEGEGAPTPAVEGEVTTNGTTQTFTPTTQETGQQAPAKEEGIPKPPEGVTNEDWAAFQQWHAEKTQGKADADGTEVTTEQAEGDEPKSGIDLLVAESLKGVAPEMAPKVEPYFRAFAETGTLTDEQVTQASKDTGFSEEMIRLYMKGAETEQAAGAALFTDQVGGADKWDGFTSWAAEALKPDDITALNLAIEQGKPGDIGKFVDLYKASGRGPAPRDLTKEAQPGAGTEAQDVFKSAAEVAKVTGSTKYRTDPEYRAAQEAKIKRSNF